MMACCRHGPYGGCGGCCGESWCRPDATDSQTVMYAGDPYAAWGNYELDLWESTPGVETCFDHFEKIMAEGDESLGRDEQSEESGISTDIPEYLDWEYMKLG